MVAKDWVETAADEITRSNSCGPLSLSELRDAIREYCPFKQGVVYVEYDESAVKFIEKLLEKGAWYNSCIELDFKADGEELKEEAVRIAGKVQSVPNKD